MLIRYMYLSILHADLHCCSPQSQMLHLRKQQFHRELYQSNIILLDLTARSIYNVKAGVYVAWNYRKSPVFQTWIVT
jgi:hypothetical protein